MSGSLDLAPNSLPVLVLFNDIIFPASQVTLTVPRALAPLLSRIVKNEDGNPPLVAAVPRLDQDSALQLQDCKLSEWGCAARIVRYVRPTPLSPNSCILTLAGVTRVKLENPLPTLSNSNRMPHHPVQFFTTEASRGVTEPAAEAFRAAALRLVERLDADARARNSKSKVTSVEWNRMRNLIGDAEAEKTPLIADILMAVITSIPWSDRLQHLSTPSPSARLQLATSIFLKQASIVEVSQKINTAVDENLTKQQKEYYLRQQLQAIQRELASLHRTSAPTDSETPKGASEFEDEGDDGEYFSEIKKKIEAMVPDSEERKTSVREFKRLKRIPAGSVENGVIRTYLDWLVSLPWPTISTSSESFDILKDSSFLTRAREQLDADHFGLETIKRRLIEYLAVIRLKALTESTVAPPPPTEALVSPPAADGKQYALQDAAPVPAPPSKSRPIRTKGPILLLVGPPGCGKTSIASSLAKALGRPFHRISLGGVRDEAEIRGHRRTYVASGPGAIITAMSKVARPDPVILLDEVDKVGHASHQGDPASALLEVLDPEQNISFKDHYINVPFDLSQVTFIATANTLDTISEPLLDRCEVIRLSGYTYPEKIHIARQFLLPKQLKENGLVAEPKEEIQLKSVSSAEKQKLDAQVVVTDDAYLHIASYYTREAGVRNLERALGSICRWKAVEWSGCLDSQKEDLVSSATSKYNPVVEVEDLEKILGLPRYDPMEREREEKRGVVYGLVVSGYGEGGVLPVESVMTGGTGKLRLTGSLGEVIRESGEIALSWVRAHAYQLGIVANPSQDPLKYPAEIDIHLHLPTGAVKKDGPSAGVAYICAFVSLLTGMTVGRETAMTGEISLRGRVLAVGGIKEKVLGAHRDGITRIILPRSNRKDVNQDVPPEVLASIAFVYVTRVEEALEAAFGPGILHHRQGIVMEESRL